jgi:hypothetical protein
MGNITPKDTRNNLASSPIPNHKITNGINAKNRPGSIKSRMLYKSKPWSTSTFNNRKWQKIIAEFHISIDVYK